MSEIEYVKNKEEFDVFVERYKGSFLAPVLYVDTDPSEELFLDFQRVDFYLFVNIINSSLVTLSNWNQFVYVNVHDKALVTLNSFKGVNFFGESAGIVKGNSLVTACQNTTIAAFDNSDIKAFSDSVIFAYDRSKVFCSESVTISLRDHAELSAEGPCFIYVAAHDYSTVKVSQNMLLTFDENVKLIGSISSKNIKSSILIDDPPLKAWLRSNDAIFVENEVILYTAVSKDFISNGGTELKSNFQKDAYLTTEAYFCGSFKKIDDVYVCVQAKLEDLELFDKDRRLLLYNNAKIIAKVNKMNLRIP